MAIQAQLYKEDLGFPLCGSQNWMMDNGYELNQICFNLQQQKQQLQQMQQQQQYLQSLQSRNQNMFQNNSLIVPTLKNNTNNNPSMAISQSLAGQLEKHRQEIDRCISLQNERLRLALEQQRKQLLATVIMDIEPKVQFLLKQKDQEIAKSMKRTMELEEFLRRLELENQAWQRLAVENEAMVSFLNNKLEELKENGYYGCLHIEAEDAESCCDVNIEEAEEVTGENRDGCGGVEGKEQRMRNNMVCKNCNSRNSCVLFLPCRHLGSCNDCAALLDSCPVCRTVKKHSIEAIIF